MQRGLIQTLALLAMSGCSCLEQDPDCLKVGGLGAAGALDLEFEVVASGLTVPWAIAFVDAETFFVSERGGRVRLVDADGLVDEPVLNLEVTQVGEGGLLGLALSPDFELDRGLYLYRTLDAGNGPFANVVERYLVDDDLGSASFDAVIVDGIPGGRNHDGGRLRFGPDGNLWITTGETFNAPLAQDPDSLGGKILRVTPEGEVPADNPFAGSPVWALGVRNAQGIDWLDDEGGELVVVLTDHGPSGEDFRLGHDELNVVRAGDNLGWPDIFACEAADGLVSPRLTWVDALPPGGVAVYRGEREALLGDLFIGGLGARQLHRVVLDDNLLVETQEHYLQRERGRLREVAAAPDGSLFITTSNCDGRGTCPPERDVILRLR